MDLKIYVIERAIKWLVGGELFSFITGAVEDINNKDISGEDKKAAVFNGAKELFSNFASVLINIAIEVAVLSLQNRLTKAV